MEYWFQDPRILFDREYITEVIPQSSMDRVRKINALARAIVFTTLTAFALYPNPKTVLIGIISLAILWIIGLILNRNQESFETRDRTNVVAPLKITSKPQFKEIIDQTYHKGTRDNPMSNVLLTDIQFNPDKKSAPPAFNDIVKRDIQQNLNDEPSLSYDDRINVPYGDVMGQYDADISNRIFYSTPSTRVVNDQAAFTQFLYGNMTSRKEQTPEAAVSRGQHIYRYTSP